MSEPVLTADLVERLSGDFYIEKEVTGFCAFNNEPVRIDLLLKAKPHLVAAGFTGEWFGVECKWIEGNNGQTSKTTCMVWQSITYAQSQFTVQGQLVRPIFVAVYTPSNLDRSIEQHLQTLLALGLYGNVGRLYFYNWGGWGIKFAWNYASQIERGGFSVKSKQLPKRRVGSC